MKNQRAWTAALLTAVVGVGALSYFLFRSGTQQLVEQGPFAADGQCPMFKPRYPVCKVRFGNRGLSVLNSAYETFMGEGAFRIDGFTVASEGDGRFDIRAGSNRGELRSEIIADRVVRLGQDRENERLSLTHQSAFCHRGRIYENQVVQTAGGSTTVQGLEYWTEGETFAFRLLQDRYLTADVRCR